MGRRTHRWRLVALLVVAVFIAGCSQDSGTCARERPGDLSDIDPQAPDYPFTYPLDGLPELLRPIMTPFCESGRTNSATRYHAAEDYAREPGTPVYAIADGDLSFSGRMDGYGWLVIVDHPQYNMYSLYGHLSPSRWKRATGTVASGDLLGYLGDDNENGGSDDVPLIPHLHFGIRAGQRSDYPGRGEWRWMAGWIHPSPRDLGWMPPSHVLAGLAIPAEGFALPESSFIEKWGVDSLLFALIAVSLIGGVVIAVLKRRPVVLIVYGSAVMAMMWFLEPKGPRVVTRAFLLVGAAILGFGVYRLLRRSTAAASSSNEGSIS